MSDILLKLEDLRYRYPDSNFDAIDGISAEFEKGSFTVVLGRNGCGKSTLARLCSGILLPTGGRVTAAGIDTRDEANSMTLRRSVGMVFQNPDNQIVANVVEDDVAFGPENLGLPPAEIRRRVDESLQAVGMYDRRLHAPHLLSGGQKQRVAIAGVLAIRPALLILDEPTAMLDPIGRREVLSVITRLCREEGLTLLLITHHMEEATEADRILVLDKGRVAMDGTPAKIFQQERGVRSLGLTVPEPAALAARLRSAGWNLKTDILTEAQCAEAIQFTLRGAEALCP